MSEMLVRSGATVLGLDIDRDALELVLDALVDVEGAWRTFDLDVDDVVDLWLGLGHVADVLGDLVKIVSTNGRR